MRIQWRYQPCPCLLAGGLASIWEAVSPLFSTFLVEPMVSSRGSTNRMYLKCVDKRGEATIRLWAFVIINMINTVCLTKMFIKYLNLI